jgi:hypothetical protein
MIHSGLANDLVVVQLMRDRIEDVPTGTPGIRRRVGQIVFNASLVAEMQAISAMRALAKSRQASASVANVRISRYLLRSTPPLTISVSAPRPAIRRRMQSGNCR